MNYNFSGSGQHVIPLVGPLLLRQTGRAGERGRKGLPDWRAHIPSCIHKGPKMGFARREREGRVRTEICAINLKLCLRALRGSASNTQELQC